MYRAGFLDTTVFARWIHDEDSLAEQTEFSVWHVKADQNLVKARKQTFKLLNEQVKRRMKL